MVMIMVVAVFVVMVVVVVVVVCCGACLLLGGFLGGRFLGCRILLRCCLAALRLRAGVLRSFLLFDRRAVHELHERHRRRVPGPRRHAQDAGIAARARAKARTQVCEELLDDRAIAQSSEGELAMRVAVGLPESDQGLDHAPQLLCLGQGGADGLVPQQRHAHVAQHGMPMRRIARQLAPA